MSTAYDVTQAQIKSAEALYKAITKSVELIVGDEGGTQHPSEVASLEALARAFRHLAGGAQPGSAIAPK